jgi:hypothetical protein
LPGGNKNIITWLVKILVGLGSFALIYWRLNNDLTPENISALKTSFTNSTAYCLLAICLLLIPVNWEIESYKWKMITTPIEKISFKTAMKSVYSGVCVGNLAPGRATEFLGKILFFKPENRPTISLLHFANGMFQLSITIITGLIGLFMKFNCNVTLSCNQITWIVLFCIVLLVAFSLFIFRFDSFQTKLIKFLKRRVEGETLSYKFPKELIFRLIIFCILRYFVFTLQFILILNIFTVGFAFGHNVVASVFVYFLLTTILPMISIIEPAVRAAIALLVFGGMGYNEISLIISAVMLWLINIVLPSIVGYIIIVQEKFEFNMFRK